MGSQALAHAAVTPDSNQSHPSPCAPPELLPRLLRAWMPSGKCLNLGVKALATSQTYLSAGTLTPDASSAQATAEQ